MASMNKLLISWNFDKVVKSTAGGHFDVLDTANDYTGYGANFPSSEYVAVKEDVLTNRKQHLETIESIDTINVVEEDDLNIDIYRKPSTVKLMIENSMYQVISDEMLNMFSSIDAYAFKFIEPYHKYRDEYDKLIIEREQFFSKIVEKPNLEKYIEFYKWLDSSLGYMLDQLIPESSNTSSGLKTTIESHILERSKYKHQLPLTIAQNRNFSSGIVNIYKNKRILSDNTLGAVANSSSFNDRHSRNSDLVYATSSIDVIDQYDLNKYSKATKSYNSIQTAGRIINSHGLSDGIAHKTIFQTRFSSVDGLSETNKINEEYSVFNELNQRARDLKKVFNAECAEGTPYASVAEDNGVTYGKQGSNTEQNFRDNLFVQRNIPWTASYNDGSEIQKLYSNAEKVNYQNIPNREVEFLHYTNLLIDYNTFTKSSDVIDEENYAKSKAIIEPPIQVNIPLKQDVLISTALEPIKIYSPYQTIIDTFSYRNVRDYSYIQQFSKNLKQISDKETFFNVSVNNTSSIQHQYTEKLDVVFPRTDLIGLAKIRFRSRYDEENGYFQPNYVDSYPTKFLDAWYRFDGRVIEPWTNNSYNINSSRIRSFWRDELWDRARTRGADQENKEYLPFVTRPILTGSFNCYNYPNRSESVSLPSRNIGNLSLFINHDYNSYNSRWAMDSDVKYTFSTEVISPIEIRSHISVSNEIYGDIGAISHVQMHKFLTIGDENYRIYPQPKPTFTHTVFINESITETETTPIITDNERKYYFNGSYQDGIDCRIKPFYDSYDEYRKNIKHKTQDMSIIPEFAVGNFQYVINRWENLNIASLDKSLLTDKTIVTPRYLTINGNERYDQINIRDFYSDIKPFIDKKNNKIKIKIKAVKKLLPYNGFYPQQRTAQIAGTFNNEYLLKTDVVSENIQSRYSTSEEDPDGNIAQFLNNSKSLSLTQPLFMPGILFNTIKAGIAVSWPVSALKISSGENSKPLLIEKDDSYFPVVYMKNSDQPNIDNYGLGTSYGVRILTHKLPFETILKPYDYYTKMFFWVNVKWPSAVQGTPYGPNDGVYDSTMLSFGRVPLESFLPYLDPTHYSTTINHKDVTTYMVGTYMRDVLTKIKNDKYPYISMINNFLAETVDFFMYDQQLTNFKSAPATEFQYAESGKTYSMDLVIYKTDNFSMFNKYTSDAVAIPSQSLFGPPVALRNEEGEEYVSALSSSCYAPYSPHYLNDDFTVVTIKFTAARDGVPTYDEVIRGLNITPDNDLTSTSEAIKKKMPLFDSIKFNITRKGIKDTYDPLTGTKNTQTLFINDQENKCLVLQTKMETPLINFNKCSIIEEGDLGYIYGAV